MSSATSLKLEPNTLDFSSTEQHQSCNATQCKLVQTGANGGVAPLKAVGARKVIRKQLQTLIWTNQPPNVHSRRGPRKTASPQEETPFPGCG